MQLLGLRVDAHLHGAHYASMCSLSTSCFPPHSCKQASNPARTAQEAVETGSSVHYMPMGRALMCTSSPITDLLSMRAHLPMDEPQPIMLSATRAKFFTCTG